VRVRNKMLVILGGIALHQQTESFPLDCQVFKIYTRRLTLIRVLSFVFLKIFGDDGVQLSLFVLLLKVCIYLVEFCVLLDVTTRAVGVCLFELEKKISF